MLEVRELDLMCRIRAASTLEEICNLGYELFGNPMLVGDLGHIVLAHTDSSRFDLPNWVDRLEEAEPSLEQQKAWRALLDRLIQNARPLLLEGAQPSDAKLMRILMYRGQPVGVAVLTALMRPMREEDPRSHRGQDRGMSRPGVLRPDGQPVGDHQPVYPAAEQRQSEPAAGRPADEHAVLDEKAVFLGGAAQRCHRPALLQF